MDLKEVLQSSFDSLNARIVTSGHQEQRSSSQTIHTGLQQKQSIENQSSMQFWVQAYLGIKNH